MSSPSSAAPVWHGTTICSVRKNGRVVIATSDPFDLESVNELAAASGKRLIPVLAARDEIERLIKTELGVGGDTVGALIAQQQEEGVELLDDRDRRVARAALDVAHIGAVNAGTVGIILLAPALLEPETAQIGGEALTDVHVVLKSAMSTNDLQTMRDIPVDLTATSSMTSVTDRRHTGRRQQGVS